MVPQGHGLVLEDHPRIFILAQVHHGAPKPWLRLGGLYRDPSSWPRSIVVPQGRGFVLEDHLGSSSWPRSIMVPQGHGFVLEDHPRIFILAQVHRGAPRPWLHLGRPSQDPHPGPGPSWSPKAMASSWKTTPGSSSCPRSIVVPQGHGFVLEDHPRILILAKDAISISEDHPGFLLLPQIHHGTPKPWLRLGRPPQTPSFRPRSTSPAWRTTLASPNSFILPQSRASSPGNVPVSPSHLRVPIPPPYPHPTSMSPSRFRVPIPPPCPHPTTPSPSHLSQQRGPKNLGGEGDFQLPRTPGMSPQYVNK
ncbi:uncharacterized protein ACIBXB_005244 isoform 2-T2 [Morphnus guianensis]